MQLLRVVVLGPPASGKGTQGRCLASELGLGYLSTGALLREHVENRTELGLLVEPILARGEYLPDGLMCPILAEWLEKQSKGWVLDGFPRSLPQAQFLDEWLSSNDLKLDAAIGLEVPYEILLERIRDRVECPECRWTGQQHQLLENNSCPKCGKPAGPRADDDEQNFRNRYEEFTRWTAPVIAHYREQEIFHSCDATDSVEIVAQNILRIFPQRPPSRES